MAPSRDRLWAIAGRWHTGRAFLYIGTWQRRTEAIEFHEKSRGRTWRECFLRGDRCVRVDLSWTMPRDKRPRART